MTLTDHQLPPDSEVVHAIDEAPDVPGHLSTAERGRLGSFLNEMRPSVATGGYPASPLVILFALGLIQELDGAAFGVLFPEIRDWFGTDLGTTILLGNLAGLFTVAVSVPIGFIADRVKRTWFVGLGAIVWATFSLAIGLSWSIISLSAFRFGAGVGKAMEAPRSSLLADYYPPKVRGTVFAFAGMGIPIAAFIAPTLAGVTYDLTGLWQIPFIVVAVPGFVIALVVMLRLREPIRGEQERRALGADEELALSEAVPPSLSESLRATFGVRTLRRLFIGLPFIVGSVSLIAPLMAEVMDQRFGLSPSARGILASISQPVAIVGLTVGGSLANRLIRTKPSRVMLFLGGLTFASGLSLAVIGILPKGLLPLLVLFQLAQAGAGAVLSPAAGAVMTLVVPPRVRGFAGGVFGVAAAVGIVFSLIVAPIANSWGPAGGLAALAAVYCIGAVIWMSAASGVEADMRAALASSMAHAEVKASKERGEAKLLVCRDVDVHYGNIQILFNVDFDVEEGEIVALLGTNGAGKSTLLRAISGLTTASNGAIYCNGDDITYLPPNEHVGKGIVLVNGGRGVFPTLTVAENLRIAAWTFRDDSAYVREATAKVQEFFPILRERADEPAGNLSGGEQQMLTLAQAFLSRPKLLMIDELSLGLSPAVVERLLEIVRAIHEQGTTIILVEQSVNVALTVAKRAVYMEKGEVRFTGPTAELLERPDVLKSVFLKGASAGGRGAVAGGASYASTGAAYGRVGSKAKERIDPGRPKVLAVRDVHKSYGGVRALNGMSFTLEEGSIVGLIGPNGAGKTTIFDVISGFVEPDSGVVELFGEDVTALPPDARARLGLMRSFQDARLFPSLTVAENLAVALERHVEQRSATMAALHLPNVRKSEAKIQRRVERLIELSNLGDFANKFVRELSTGSRRIVDLAVVLAADPKVILLDEPSSGVAQREAEELGPLLLRIRYETGCSMLLIEHDMPLISAVSDELIALDLGKDKVRGLPDEVMDDPQVQASYLGTSEEVIRRSGRADATDSTTTTTRKRAR